MHKVSTMLPLAVFFTQRAIIIWCRATVETPSCLCNAAEAAHRICPPRLCSQRPHQRNSLSVSQKKGFATLGKWDHEGIYSFASVNDLSTWLFDQKIEWEGQKGLSNLQIVYGSNTSLTYKWYKYHEEDFQHVSFSSMILSFKRTTAA